MPWCSYPPLGLPRWRVSSRHPPAVLIEDVRAAVQQHVDEFVTTRTDTAVTVPITVQALAGKPGPELCDAAGACDLLVIGHHSHDSVAGGLLGSVGLHCVLHARCPVTVVRGGPVSATESGAQGMSGE